MLVIAGILIYTIIAFGIRVPRANDSPPPAPEEADLSPPIATSDNSTSTWNGTVTTGRNAATDMSSRGCFPSLGFTMPQTVPPSTNGWWCNLNTEYAFLGFSYDVTACKSFIFINLKLRRHTVHRSKSFPDAEGVPGCAENVQWALYPNLWCL